MTSTSHEFSFGFDMDVGVYPDYKEIIVDWGGGLGDEGTPRMKIRPSLIPYLYALNAMGKRSLELDKSR